MPSQERSVEPTLYAELIRRGLPADYAQRTADELDDHRADLLADLHSADADNPDEIANERLGETRQLAKKIARDYQRRSWFGRWPLISFLIAPVVILNAVWTAIIYAIYLVGVFVIWTTGGSLEGGEAGRDTGSAWVFYYVVLIAFSFLIPCAVTWWYSRYALLGAQSRAYLLAACLSFGFMNGLVYHDVWVDPDNAEVAMNGFGMMLGDVSTMTKFFLRPIQLAQLLAPVLVGVVLLHRDRRRRLNALLAAPACEGPVRVAA